MAPHFDPYYTWLGIRPEDRPANHYRLLGLQKLEDDPDVITNAVDQRVNYLLTLQSGAQAAQAQRLIEEVRSAGSCLIDARQKARYDRELLAQIERAAAATAAPQVAAPAVVPVHSLPIPEPVTLPPRPLGAPVSKADPNTQVALVVTGVVTLAVVGVAVIAAQRFLRKPETQVVSSTTTSRAAKVVPYELPIREVEPIAAVQSPDEAPATVAATISPEPQTVDPPMPAPVEPTTPQRIDLLFIEDRQLRTPLGKFARAGTDLVLEGRGNALEFPVPLPAEYALEVDVVREAGDNSLCFTLPVAGRPLTAIVDGFNSQVSGLAAIGGSEIFTPNHPQAKTGRLLTNGRPSTVRVEVTAEGVRLLVDRALVTEWKSSPSTQIRAAKGMHVADPRKLTIFTWDTRYRLKRIEVIPLAQSDSTNY
jgi:hypothetical protein